RAIAVDATGAARSSGGQVREDRIVLMEERFNGGCVEFDEACSRCFVALCDVLCLLNGCR
ncbi:MAG TPA: hypothetical protein VMU42_10630, partial [Candidatus Sulfotelmatobacter sp.]|nr:hypothetical protein [Candidatus Sulfotelmatobacter sp.]